MNVIDKESISWQLIYTNVVYFLLISSDIDTKLYKSGWRVL